MTRFDSLHRPIEYLRLSVTDRCNLRCLYCMPPEGVPWCAHEEILRYEEMERVVRAAVSLGIRRVRLTGGEPLVRKGLVGFIAALAAIPGLEDLAMTTNGMLLAPVAEELAAAGLHRVNVSLDSLDAARFSALTRGGSLAAALEGITAARGAGLAPVKINTVVIRGRNDDEVIEFARRTARDGWHVRFIEFMPVGRWHESEMGEWQDGFVPAAEVRERIETVLGPLQPDPGVGGAGPARSYRLAGAVGTVGFISAVSEHFCAGCNRLRLSADGRLRPCLLADDEIDVRALLRAGASDEQLRAVIVEAIQHKPARHRLPEGAFPRGRTMSEIGG
jgi:cyclic pyranopterin phosphate synthase